MTVAAVAGFGGSGRGQHGDEGGKEKKQLFHGSEWWIGLVE
jgi:hypothetical protein